MDSFFPSSIHATIEQYKYSLQLYSVRHCARNPHGTYSLVEVTGIKQATFAIQAAHDSMKVVKNVLMLDDNGKLNKIDENSMRR